MKTKRKKYLMMKNHHVLTTKNTLAQILERSDYSSIQYILFPVNQGSTYIPIDAETLQDLEFVSAEVRFHMVLKQAEVHDDKPCGHRFRYATLYDYYTTTVSANTLEELYLALFNILKFEYIEDLFGGQAMDNLDFASFGFVYIDVEDIDISVVYDEESHKANHVEFSRPDNDAVPFDTRCLQDISRLIMKEFGIHILSENRLHLQNICFSVEHGTLTWKLNVSSIPLTHSVRFIGVSNLYATSYTILPMQRYDALLMLNRSFITMRLLRFDSFDCINLPYLPITTYYGMHRYSFGSDGVKEEETGYVLLDAPNVVEDVYTMELYDTDEIIIFIEFLSDILKVFHEYIKYSIAHDKQSDDLSRFDLWSTVFVEMNMDVTVHADYPSDVQLEIRTDLFQDHQVCAKDVATVLQCYEVKETS